jgi:16S rRNA (uracil1498-N3)-methyltransferase
MSDKTRRAFLDASPAPGDVVALDAEESHHVARVLRVGVGEAISVFDGRGGEWDARIEEASRDRVSVRVGAPRPGGVEPNLRVVLHQALVRPEKLEWVLQKGTELGVSAFRLIASERAEAPPPTPTREARYRRILMEACKQSGRRVLPTLELGELDPAGNGVTAIVLALGSELPPIGEVLAVPATSEVWLGVGPEGGFSDAELEAAGARGWRQASLGPRVLRTETAGAVAAAIVLHRWADLG